MASQERREWPGVEHEERVSEELRAAFPAEAVTATERASSVGRLLFWASMLLYAGVGIAGMLLWGLLWGLGLAFLLYGVTNVSVVTLAGTDRLVTEKCPAAAREDFTGAVTPLTASLFLAAAAVLEPSAEDPEDVVAVVEQSGPLTASRTVRVRERTLDDGRLGVSLGSQAALPLVAIDVGRRGGVTTVDVEGTRGPISLLEVVIVLISGRYQARVFRSFGYTLEDSTLELGLGLSQVLPWR